MKRITLIAGMLLISSTSMATSIGEAISKVFKNPQAIEIISIRNDLKLNGHLVPILLKVGGNPQLTYFDGNFIIMGDVMPVNMESRTQMVKVAEAMKGELAKLELDNRYSIESENWKNVLSRKDIVEGSGTEIYVFHDPFCHYCDKLFLETRDAVKSGKLKIHWIPVGILSAASIDVSAYLNKGNNGMNEWHDKVKKDEILNYKANKTEREEVEAATNIFKKLGLSGTPSILYPHDGIVDTIGGYLPADNLIRKLDYLKTAK